MIIIKLSCNLDNIIRKYDELNDLQDISEILKGHVCKKWLLNTSDNKFFLKRLDKSNSYNRVKFITESQRYISNFNGNAPKIYNSKKNNMFIEFDGDYYILNEYIDGKIYNKYELNNNDFCNIGVFLGSLHKNYSNFTSYPGDDLRFKLDMSPQTRIEQLIDYHKTVSKDEFCLESLKYKLDKLNTFNIEKLNHFDNLPKQIIHGDFYIDNIIFSNDKSINAIVDFDQSSKFYRIYEIMRAIMLLAFDTNNTKSFEEKFSCFFSSYLEVNNLSQMEADSMIYLYYWILLLDTFCFEPNDNKNLDYLSLRDFGEYRINILKWMSGHLEFLNELIIDVYSNK